MKNRALLLILVILLILTLTGCGVNFSNGMEEGDYATSSYD